MGKVYTTGVWTLALDTEETQTSATTTEIVARSPAGVEETFTATATTTVLSYTFAITDIASPGYWAFWSESTISGNLGIGEPVEILIHAPGNMKGD